MYSCGEETELKVLHVVPSMSPKWGGPTTSTAGLTAALVRLGVECEIVTTRGPRVGNDPVQVPGVPMHCFHTGFPGRAWTGWSRGLPHFLAEQMHGFDLVHVQEIWHHPGYAASHAARSHGVPLALSVHGELDSWRLRHKAIRKMLYLRGILRPILRNAAAIHALTLAEARNIEVCGIDTPVFVAPNGVASHLPARPADKSQFLARHPRLADRRVILFLSRLHAMKGLDVLARSFTTVAAKFPDAVLLVAGGPDEDGSGRRAMEVLEQAGLRDRVVFVGLLTGAAKQAAFDCADLFVLSSYSEGFSVVVLEAMAAGLPVVISDRCNFPEAAEHEASFIVPAQDGPVAEAIGTLLADDGLRRRMGQNGQRLVTERYTWPAIAASFADWYRTLVRK